MNWINFVKGHKGVRVVKGFRPVCGNSYFEGGASKTLYGWVK